MCVPAADWIMELAGTMEMFGSGAIRAERSSHLSPKWAEVGAQMERYDVPYQGEYIKK